MRHPFRLVFLGAVALAVVVAVACGDSAPPVDPGPSTDAGKRPTQPETRPGDPDTGPPVSTMRIAHLAPGLGPIDFCYQAAHVGSLEGPVLGVVGVPKPDDASADSAADAGGADAGAQPDDAGDASDAGTGAKGETRVDAGPIRPAAYRSVSKYLNLATSGPITIAIVEAGATSCGSPIAKGTVTLDPGKLSTVVLFGSYVADAGAELSIASFTDDRTTSADAIRVRVIHAALGTATSPPSSALAVRAVGPKTTLLSDRVEPRRSSTASSTIGVDGLGYVTAPPLPPPSAIAIGPAMTDGGADAGFDPWQSQPKDLDLRGGSLHTAFILSSNDEAPFELLWCADTTTSGDQTTCSLIR